MPKLITRISAIILIPCLMVDSAFSAVALISSSPAVTGRGPIMKDFTSQALAQPPYETTLPERQIGARIKEMAAKMVSLPVEKHSLPLVIEELDLTRPLAYDDEERIIFLFPMPDGIERWVSPLDSLGWAWLSWRLTRAALSAMGYGTTIHEAPDLFTAVTIYIVISGVLATVVNWALHRFIHWLFRRDSPKLTLWGGGLGDRSALIPAWFLSAATAAAIVFVFSELAEHFMTPYQWLCLNAWTYYSWGLGQVASVFGSAHTLLHYLHNLTHGPGYRWSLIPTRPAAPANKTDRLKSNIPDHIMETMQTFEGVVHYPFALDDFDSVLDLSIACPRATLVLSDGFVRGESSRVTLMPDPLNATSVQQFLRRSWESRPDVSHVSMESRPGFPNPHLEVTIHLKESSEYTKATGKDIVRFTYIAGRFEKIGQRSGIVLVKRPGFAARSVYQDPNFWPTLHAHLDAPGYALVSWHDLFAWFERKGYEALGIRRLFDLRYFPQANDPLAFKIGSSDINRGGKHQVSIFQSKRTSQTTREPESYDAPLSPEARRLAVPYPSSELRLAAPPAALYSSEISGSVRWLLGLVNGVRQAWNLRHLIEVVHRQPMSPVPERIQRRILELESGGIRFVTASPQHQEAAIHLFRQAFPDDDILQFEMELSLALGHGPRNYPQSYLLLALESQEIVGMGLRHLLPSGKAAHLRAISVTKNRQREGIGMALIGHLIGRILEEWSDVRHITLNAKPENGTDHIMQDYFGLTPRIEIDPLEPRKIHGYVIRVPERGFRGAPWFKRSG